MADELGIPSRYITADLATLQDVSWLRQQWEVARELAKIEVKSNQKSIKHSGIDSFVKQFNPDRILLVGDQGIPLKSFLSTVPSSLFE